MGWWRAGVLLGVHLLAAVHIAHWLSTGSSLSPLEPSESKEFSERGVVNAGLIFFSLTLLSTLVLGRFFCGWACHLVALQDGARWLLKRFGVTPRPLRSRVLLFVPLLAALYMFGVPLAHRAYAGEPLAPQALELTTSGFWDTFPSWPVSVATFVTCGFLCVYLLGSKGFCTYACPYGGLFALLEPLAPGRIRVSDACNHCGQCTSVCSSNVLVHAEVRDYGAVVDPGCMRCMDCVSVCPTDALSFGFGKPALLTKARSAPPPRKGPGWGEEMGMLAVFAVSFLCFRGLFGWVPFLFALGIAGCCAALARLGWRLFTRPSVKLGGWALKKGGARTRLGTLYLLGLCGLALLTAYAGAIQLFEREAAQLHDATGAIRGDWEEVLMRHAQGERLSEAEQAQVAEALAASERVSRWSPVETSLNLRRLAWLRLLAGDDAATEAALQALLDAHPDAFNVQFDAANYYASRNRPDEAEAAYRRALELDPHPGERRYFAYAQLLRSRGKHEEALALLREGVERLPEGHLLPQVLGQALAEGGELEQAIAAYEEALARGSEQATALHVQLGRLLTQLRRFAEGAAHYEVVLEDPSLDPRQRRYIQHGLGLAWADAGEPAKARPHLEALLPEDGFRDPEVLRALADVLDALGEAERAAELRAEWEAFRRGE